MKRDWFFPNTLALRLASRGVPNREVAYLMLANLLYGSVLYYGAFTWANPPWTLLSLAEFVIVVLITLIGFTKCFDAAGGEANDRFAVDLNCLSFGVWFWTSTVIWSIFWFGIWLLRQGIFAAYNFERLGLAQNLAAIGASFSWLWTFLAIVGSQVVYFSWLAAALRKVDAHRATNLSLNTDSQASRLAPR